MAPFSLRHLLVLAIIGLAGAGAWFSGTLLVGHDGGWSAERLGTGYLLQSCGAHALPGVNCADVVGSRWGSVDFFLDSRRIMLPTSLIGLIYFVSIGIWFAMTGPIDGRRTWLWRLTLLVITCGLAGSMFFSGVMARSLSRWCPLCVAAHVAK